MQSNDNNGRGKLPINLVLEVDAQNITEFRGFVVHTQLTSACLHIGVPTYVSAIPFYQAPYLGPFHGREEERQSGRLAMPLPIRLSRTSDPERDPDLEV